MRTFRSRLSPIAPVRTESECVCFVVRFLYEGVFCFDGGGLFLVFWFGLCLWVCGLVWLLWGLGGCVLCEVGVVWFDV